MKIVTNIIWGFVISSAVLASGYSSGARAQTIIELSTLKCGDYLESPPVRQEQFAAWMSGYFNAARNLLMVDLKRFATNKRIVEKYCKGHRKENFMNAIRKVAI